VPRLQPTRYQATSGRPRPASRRLRRARLDAARLEAVLVEQLEASLRFTP
jgi:hypothetical protein